jgi:hypothetical protein
MRINRSQTFRRLKDESDKMGLQFVITELKLCLALLDIADHSFNRERQKRLRQNAVRSYETILEALRHLSPEAKVHHEINEKVRLIRTRLKQLGMLDAVYEPLRNAG